MGFDRIDVSHLPRPERAAAGKRPNLGWVAIADLVVDRAYQRDMGEKNWRHVERIAADFDWDLFSVVDVAPAEAVEGGPDVTGKYAIIDGQHRVHAAALVGIDKVPCRVVATARRGQARAFARINGDVTAMTVWHLYRAALAAGEPWAVAAHEICAGAGCRLMTANSTAATKKARDIYAVGLVRQFAEREGLHAALHAALAALSEARAGDNVGLWAGHVLRAWLLAVETRNELWPEKRCFAGLAQLLDTPAAKGGLDLARLAIAARDDVFAARDAGRRGMSITGLLQSRIEVALAELVPTRAALFALADARREARR